MADQTIHVFLDVEVPAEKRARFEAVMARLVAEAEAEPGTLVYEWNLAGDGTTCHIHERYRDVEHGNRHVRNFAENHAGPFFEAVGSVRAAVYGEPGNYIRSVLDGVRPTYFTRLAGFNRF